MSIRGIFFDLYGTLLVYGNMKQAWADWLSMFYDLLKEQGFHISKEAFAKECDGFFSTPEPAGDGNELTALERRIHALCRRLDHDMGPEALGTIADTIAQAWQAHITIDPEAIPVLDALKQDKKIGLISNFDHPPHVRRILSTGGLEKFFDTIVISSEVGVKKPDPSIFMFALKQTGLSNAEVAYVGDTDEDVTGAVAAGIRPIFIKRPANRTYSDALDFQATHRSEALVKNLSSSNDKIIVISSLKEVLQDL